MVDKYFFRVLRWGPHHTTFPLGKICKTLSANNGQHDQNTNKQLVVALSGRCQIPNTIKINRFYLLFVASYILSKQPTDRSCTIRILRLWLTLTVWQPLLRDRHVFFALSFAFQYRFDNGQAFKRVGSHCLERVKVKCRKTQRTSLHRIESYQPSWDASHW